MKMTRLVVLSLVAILTSLQWGCKNDEGDILPSEIQLGTAGDAVILPNTSLLVTTNTDVNWISADFGGGTIDENGLYQAPATAGAYLVTAVSKADPKLAASIVIYVTSRAEAFKALRRGRAILYINHTRANIGSDHSSFAPPWWKSCDKDTAAQLSQTGMENAELISEVMKNMGIVVERAISSEFCRCRQTAALIAPLAALSTDKALTADVYVEAERHSETMALMGTAPSFAGETLLIVSHALAPNHSPLPQIPEGGSIVFVPQSGNKVAFIADLFFSEWAELLRQ